ncbi:hypothetical protein RFI_36110, partial [Reticulomyxa filosa]
MVLAKLPTSKAKILAKTYTRISNPFYFGDSADEVENRLKKHSSDLFAVTATIAPNQKYRKRNDTIKYECYPFPCRASKDADCSRGVCTSCNTHFYLYHKYESIWQFQCGHHMCRDCVHKYFEICYEKHLSWPKNLNNFHSMYIRKYNITDDVAFALRQLVKAKCAHLINDGETCDQFVFCPCNDSRCTKIREFAVGRHNGKIPK